MSRHIVGYFVAFLIAFVAFTILTPFVLKRLAEDKKQESETTEFFMNCLLYAYLVLAGLSVPTMLYLLFQIAFRLRETCIITAPARQRRRSPTSQFVYRDGRLVEQEIPVAVQNMLLEEPRDPQPTLFEIIENDLSMEESPPGQVIKHRLRCTNI